MLLIEIGNQGEAGRAALEQFGLRVTLVRIGQARHLVAVLSDIGTAEYVVLDCHGEDGDIVIPELAPELETKQPFCRRMTPEDLATFARLDGAVVISTGCTTATPAMGQAVIGRCALGYLAPAGYPTEVPRSSQSRTCSTSSAKAATSAKPSSSYASTTRRWPCGACTPHLHSPGSIPTRRVWVGRVSSWFRGSG